MSKARPDGEPCFCGNPTKKTAHYHGFMPADAPPLAETHKQMIERRLNAVEIHLQDLEERLNARNTGNV